MLKLIVLLIVICVTTARYIPQHEPLSDELIHYVNNVANTTWTARPTNRFRTISDIRRVLGYHINPNKRGETVTVPTMWHDVNSHPDIPDNFDSRQQWSNCSSIGEIRDQGECASCWALGAVEAMTDRICIHSNGQQKPRLGAEDLVSCCAFCSVGGDGCRGAEYLITGWKFYETTGIVSGGSYEQKTGCRPYSFPTCSTWDFPIPGLLNCSDEHIATPKCVKHCQPTYNKKYRQDKHYGATSYAISKEEQQIQIEIMKNGPVEAGFMVYADFINYKSGVYQHVTGEYQGAHGVKIFGWGVENKTPYWLVANSWNTHWGDKGFFKILRGKDECRIESADIVAGLPKLV